MKKYEGKIGKYVENMKKHFHEFPEYVKGKPILGKGPMGPHSKIPLRGTRSFQGERHAASDAVTDTIPEMAPSTKWLPPKSERKTVKEGLFISLMISIPSSLFITLPLETRWS